MTRRTGDNYSGPRRLFPMPPAPADRPGGTYGEGVSISGGSDRPTETHRDITRCGDCHKPLSAFWIVAGRWVRGCPDHPGRYVPHPER